MEKRTKCSICFIVLGLLLLIGGVISLVLVDYLFKQNLEIKEGSIQYENWYDPTVPLYLQWYVFNLTNPDEVLENYEKPKLEQLGPYTYSEHRKKVNITWHENGTVTYNNLRWWVFLKDQSNGSLNDTVITANLPLLTVAESLVYQSQYFQETFGVLASMYKEKAFKTYTMHELVWGYHDPMMTTAMDLLPDWFYTDFLGIYAGKNYTNDGLWTVNTGANDISKVGQIEAYNGTKSLHFWSTEYANMINGTDGSMVKPNLNNNDRVQMFIPDLCRSLYAVHAGNETTAEGIPLYRFSSDAQEMANTSINPDNAGFCTPTIDHCLGAGLINVSNCQILDSFNIPIILSMPHFLYADDRYLDAVEGLNPDPVQHRTDISVEPRTGIPMRIARRMQVNIYLKPMPYISQLQHLPKLVLPMVWLNESMLVDKANEDKFNHLMTLMAVGQYGGYVALALGGAAFLVTITVLVVLFIKRRNSSRHGGYQNVPTDDDDVAPLPT